MNFFANKRVVEAVVFLIIGILVGLIVMYLNKGELVYLGGWGKPHWKEVESFEDCVTAGNPVMESYPERCMTPSGKSFTKQY